MILTITANAALDRVIFIDRFEPTTVMRSRHIVDSVGGKGLDASIVLSSIGAPNFAISFIAGRNGKYLQELLDDYKIQYNLVSVKGETRIANVIIETDLHRHSHIMTPGYQVSDSDCSRLLDQVKKRIGDAQWVIMGGSLPSGTIPDFYGKITEIAHKAGVKVLIDTPGEPVLKSLYASPEIVKFNKEEFAATFNIREGPLLTLARSARSLLDNKGIQNIVITCGEEGILAITHKYTYLAKGPKLKAVNAAGAGDAVSASVAYRLSLGDTWEQALRWSIAISAAVVLTERTAECRMEDVLQIYPQAVIDQLF
jgi:1-phosphofructokinase family hexose kinase